jgi:hypothetical protein
LLSEEGTCLQKEGVKTTQIQAGKKEEKKGLLVYSVRDRREKKYANSEKRAVHSTKLQARGGLREGGLCKGGLVYHQPSHGKYIN